MILIPGAQRGESWHSDAAIFISFRLPTCAPSTFETLYPGAKLITDLSRDRPSVSPLVTAVHPELILAGRLQEPFFSWQGAGGEERGILHWKGVAGTLICSRSFTFWSSTAPACLFQSYIQVLELKFLLFSGFGTLFFNLCLFIF